MFSIPNPYLDTSLTQAVIYAFNCDCRGQVVVVKTKTELCISLQNCISVSTFYIKCD